MQKLSGNGIHFFRLFGVDVYLHWTWLLVAAVELQQRREVYASQFWNVAEYLTLFGIVLMHEYGHALACRSVGGVAERIMLWPLGGVAFVNPPPRPGALLWSIVAGPLVNVLLLPVTLGLYAAFGHAETDVGQFVWALAMINGMLLVFNLLPIYPLDGGQILRALLWFVFGRANSLMIASVIGVIGAAAFGAFAFWAQSIWLGILALFGLIQCWSGVQQARLLRRLLNGPRHEAFACPVCRTSPPAEPLWRCDRCGAAFDAFATNAACPQCAATFASTMCLHCGQRSPISAWARGPALAPLRPPVDPYIPPDVRTT